MHPRDYSNIQRLKYIEKMPSANNIENLEILLHLDSFCLGDTLCFSSYLDAFFNFHKPKKMTVSTFWPELFENQENYSFINAVGDETLSIDKLVNIGYQKENLQHTLNGMFYAAKETMNLPLETNHSKPPVKHKIFETKQNKITIAPESLKKISRWDYIGNIGWQHVVDYLVSKGFEVHSVSYEKTLFLKNVIYHEGNDDIGGSLQHIGESKIFIGLSSGLSWLAWAYDVPVVMIAGFTKKYNEFDCYRVLNERCCNGCFNVFPNIKSACPLFQGTERELECQRTITPEMVIEQVDKALNN